jgi:heme/copper-type cytochrome/quinol oxidase subunit 2
MDHGLHAVRRAALPGLLLLFGLLVVSTGSRPAAQEQAPTQREFDVTAKKYAFSPALLEAIQDDLVRITLHSDDIAHSFTVDAYRIAKRVGGGQTVTFEFRADQAGSFPIYCNLRHDEGCREMRGELVVRNRAR